MTSSELSIIMLENKEFTFAELVPELKYMAKFSVPELGGVVYTPPVPKSCSGVITKAKKGHPIFWVAAH